MNRIKYQTKKNIVARKQSRNFLSFVLVGFFQKNNSRGGWNKNVMSGKIN